MDEKRKEELRLRLIRSGHNGMDLTPTKYAKLDALDKAVTLMIERRARAQKEFRDNELTGVNIERVLKELGGETITDQTLNKTMFYHNFILTYEDSEVFRDLKEQIKRLRQEFDEAKADLALLHARDAECQEALIEADNLRKRNAELEEDKIDMEIKLSRLINKGKSNPKVKMRKIEIPVDTEDIAKS